MVETLQTLEEDIDVYEVDLPVFQGPLDLLLSLIEQEELDITKIALARVTDQYLARLEIIEETDPDDLTDFLVIAAKLILIKSEVLLPRPPLILIEADEEDVGDELARQLLIYKQFKELAAHLRDLESRGERGFVRIMPQLSLKIEPKLPPGEGDIAALLAAARAALAVKPEEPAVDEVVSPELVTIGQQMAYIWHKLAAQKQVTFQKILGQSRNRLEIIVTLLAILELIKRNIIVVAQPTYFGDIIIARKEGVAELSQAEWEELVGLVEVS
jgi:segregation and condensation protein A